METVFQIPGAKVICAEDGSTLGVVDSVVCTGNDQVLGMLVLLGTITSRYGFVCIEDILASGNGTICILNQDSLQKDKKLLQKYRKKGAWKWLDKKAVTPEGIFLGTISDGVFDVHTGKISQIELSLGVVEDLRDGRRRFSLNEKTEFGKEFLVLQEVGRQDE